MEEEEEEEEEVVAAAEEGRQGRPVTPLPTGTEEFMGSFGDALVHRPLSLLLLVLLWLLLFATTTPLLVLPLPLMLLTPIKPKECFDALRSGVKVHSSLRSSRRL